MTKRIKHIFEGFLEPFIGLVAAVGICAGLWCLSLYIDGRDIAQAAPPTTEPDTAISASVPSQANPYIVLEFDATYEGERWISVEWGCSATNDDEYVLLHRDFGDDAVSSLISSDIANRWQRAVGEIWFIGYPQVIVAGPDFFDVHLSDGLNLEEMEATAVWINGILWYHDACGQRPHKGGPDTTA